MRCFVAFSETRRKRNAFLAALAVSSFLTLPGCGIPNLRCAQPGAAMPQTYNFANGWQPATSQQAAMASYESPSVDPNAPSDEEAPDPLESNAGKKKLSGPARLVSFLKPAKSIDLQDPGSPATPSADANIPSVPAVPGTSPSDMPTSPIDGLMNSATGNGYIQGSNGMDPIVTSFENSANFGWHQFFDDPYLTGLIDQALVDNQELKILAEEIQVASNEVFARSGEYRPFVTLGTGAGIEKSSVYSRNGAVEENLLADGKAFPDPLPDFLVASNLSWEIDIWRKLRNARDAACLRYLGTRDGRNYVVTRMVAEVAENYYELLALDNRLMTLDKTIAIQEASLKAAEAMKAAAEGTELAVQRFQAEVRKNQSEKLIIVQQIVEAENRINFLLGRYPQPVERKSVEYIDLNLNALSAGVPAQLLQNRSDIRQAERELQAAGLDVKVARARFYPSLTLSAGLGYRAFDAGFLFSTPGSLIYNAAGDLVAPLINKRAIKAAYLSANAKQLQAVYTYQQTVLNAYTEVINHMAKVENYRQSIEIKKQQLASLEASVDSASKLFQSADADYMEVLLAQRDMMEAKMVLIETKQQQLGAIVRVYQALGGGGTLNTIN